MFEVKRNFKSNNEFADSYLHVPSTTHVYFLRQYIGFRTKGNWINTTNFFDFV